jgi:hypothetical protein
MRCGGAHHRLRGDAELEAGVGVDAARPETVGELGQARNGHALQVLVDVRRRGQEVGERAVQVEGVHEHQACAARRRERGRPVQRRL